MQTIGEFILQEIIDHSLPLHAIETSEFNGNNLNVEVGFLGTRVAHASMTSVHVAFIIDRKSQGG